MQRNLIKTKGLWNMCRFINHDNYICVTAGSTYLDIDAYACCVAMAELLCLQGKLAVAYSPASCNYSVCASLTEKSRISTKLSTECKESLEGYIIVDVSDPDYIRESVPLDRVIAVYDHHVGFESYWEERIGVNAHIEFLGAAATLIYREWKQAGLQNQMSAASAKLLVAAILDNTLNLTSANTTDEDRVAFRELCILAGVDEDWRENYFSEVQKTIEADLKNALMGDLKTVNGNPVLPPLVAQLCVWDADSVLKRLPEIRQWCGELREPWMINIIELKHQHNYFVCDDRYYQKRIESVFDVCFQDDVARTDRSYLRKELIKKTYNIL